MIDIFALIAFVCFLLALFGVHLGTLDLVVLGLAFVALHLLFGSLVSLPTFRRTPPAN